MFESKKGDFINNIFTAVCNDYDLMNDIMSFGAHRLWKERMISHIINGRGKLLDVASGTGDIGIKIAKKSELIDVVLYDINENMVKMCRNKAVDLNLLNLNLCCGSAEHLAFPDNEFDYYSISFGIRNVVDRRKALEEAYRVLKFGGKFICLEFSPINDKGIFKMFYDFYSLNIIPKLGKLFAKNQEAYEYLVESIRLFPKQECFKGEIEEVGFFKVNYYNMSCGIVSIYTGWKDKIH